MFSLVIVIISIALVGAVALAGAFYGSSTFFQGDVNAQVSRRVLEGQQIFAALTMMDTQAKAAGKPLEEPTLAALVSGGYLKQAPKGWSITCSEIGCQVSHSLGGEGAELCKALNKKAGIGESLDVTVHGLASSLFHCLPIGEESNYSDFVMNYMYAREGGT